MEVLRDGPSVVEFGWVRFTDVVEQLATAGTIRVDVLDRQVRDEPHRAARARWADVRQALFEDVSAA
ncbi:MAG: hypothetical protein OXF41_09365 [bacterium]|nr:hypothetical protein [bacterium]